MTIDFNKLAKEVKEEMGELKQWVKIKDLETGFYPATIFDVVLEEDKDYFGEQADEVTFRFELEDGRAASNSFVFKHNSDETTNKKLLGALIGTSRVLGANNANTPAEIVSTLKSLIDFDKGIKTTVEIFKIEGLQNNRSKFVKGAQPVTNISNETQTKVEEQVVTQTNDTIDLDSIKF